MSTYGLDYPYTCPSIDGEIRDAKAILESHVEDILQELNPLMAELTHTPEFNAWIKSTVDAMYTDLEPIFENCRGINDDMRSEASRQIAECVSELEDCQQQLRDLEEGL
ncbi:coil containing protein [Vibrio phage 1.121.O._10N.286.46.C4]|nr:coil containing protein [Vibrio phage 1.121.O._10N.286.46.C4]